MNPAQYLPLVRTVVGAYFRRGMPAYIERDDLIQAAMLRLCKDLHRSKPENANAFAYQMAKWAIQDELRKWWTPTDLVETDSVPTDEPGPEQIIERRQEIKELHRAISRLPRRQSEVASGIAAGLTQHEIAAWMGTSDANVSFLKRGALRNLRTRLQARGVHR